MVSQYNITHILLSLIYREEKVNQQFINIRKANLKPMKTKLIKFGKKIGKWSLKDNNFKGIKYFTNSRGNSYYKYQSPYQREYNKNGEIADEIIIYAKPNTATSYIFYDKKQAKLFYGITDASFTFHPDEVIHIYSEELNSLQDAPIEARITFILDNKVNECRYAMKHYDEMDLNLLRREIPIPSLIVSFPNYIFSRVLSLKDVEDNYSDNFGKWLFRMSFPFTGFRKKTAIREWTRYKNAIPKPSTSNNPNVVHRVMEDGNLSDEEPLTVKRDRLKRNAAIEAAIEAMHYTSQELTMADIPEPDEHGYISFDRPLYDDNYDMNFPERMFRNFLSTDNGDVMHYFINGRPNLFLPHPELEKN